MNYVINLFFVSLYYMFTLNKHILQLFFLIVFRFIYFSLFIVILKKKRLNHSLCALDENEIALRNSRWHYFAFVYALILEFDFTTYSEFEVIFTKHYFMETFSNNLFLPLTMKVKVQNSLIKCKKNSFELCIWRYNILA